MAQGETPITLVGNVVADPEIRYTNSGVAVANFRVASTPRVFDRNTNQWTDGEALFLTCNVWRDMASNVADTLTKGMRVIVQGKLRQRGYTTRDGENRTVYEIEVDEVGPSLKFASAQVNRNPRSGGQGGGGYGGGNAGGPGGQSRQGFSGGQQRQGFGGGQPAEDPWGSAPQAGDFGDGGEPPF
ncbi:single-stranded DNA-binding protein [Corynebacterium sp.]|uniref:single-stranded DNA-binding protein n=1 Tax=Corynebacterium sp. TaxID=1720 RepID=UPI0026DC28E2|nr:single-stranded DNA-binding protein [Corynebacterium sp.]MDO4611055.1 single-stranded DNA-binding protein [Corynebacterium sp.]